MSRGVLLIHGFTATPACLQSLAVPLQNAGYDIEAPLLAGHGRTVADLERARWQDWFEDVKTAHKKLKERNKTLFAAGLSLGGLLTLKLALEERLEAIALLATPLFFRGFMTRVMLPLIGSTPLVRLIPYQTKWAGPAIADPVQRKQFENYSKMPIRAAMEIVRLQRTLGNRLSEIKSPALILHSPQDTVAPYPNMSYLKEHLGSSHVETVTLQRSNHVLTMDYERDFVARKVLDFFKAAEERKK